VQKDGRLPLEHAIEIVAIVAEALDFAHERGIVHRDIKPANLMMLADGTVKVADFGIARLTTAAATMTADMMIGTPHYMSPEQVTGGKIDGRSDIFSLGVVLYELATRRRPFDAESLPTILHQILNVDPPPPHAVEPSVPPALGAIIAKAIARDPENRYARAKNFAADLRRMLEGNAKKDATSRTETLPAEGRRRLPIAGALVAAVLALALGVAGWMWKRQVIVDTADVRFVADAEYAEVWLDGQFAGRTPLLKQLPAGTYEVQFRKDGYFSYEQTLKVKVEKPDEKVEVNATMRSAKEG
jgi:hypothetical protein